MLKLITILFLALLLQGCGTTSNTISDDVYYLGNQVSENTSRLNKLEESFVANKTTSRASSPNSSNEIVVAQRDIRFLECRVRELEAEIICAAYLKTSSSDSSSYHKTLESKLDTCVHNKVANCTKEPIISKSENVNSPMTR